MKPDDLKALSEALRDTLSGSLAEGGYSVTQKPGPGVVYLRVALTDVMVEKKKRGLLAYTPAGAVIVTSLVPETKARQTWADRFDGNQHALPRSPL